MTTDPTRDESALQGEWTDRLRSLCGEQCAQFGEPSCSAVVSDALPCSRCLLIDALSVFLGHDDRFQIMVGGNPQAVEEMTSAAQYAFDYATKVEP